MSDSVIFRNNGGLQSIGPFRPLLFKLIVVAVLVLLNLARVVAVL